MKFYLIILFFILNNSIFSENFSSYSLSYSHPTTASLLSLGVGLKNSEGLLYSNPALLITQNRSILDGSLQLNHSNKNWGPILPTAMGFFVLSENNWGWGVRGKQVFYKTFPFDEKNFTYSFSLFGAYQWNSISLSMGIGPSTSFRNNVQSSYSWSPFLSIAYSKDKHTLAALVESIGKFRMEGYRGSDKLFEKMPEYFSLGYHYSYSEKIQAYIELNRIFWENTEFNLNDERNKPKFSRGFGAEYWLSGGLILKPMESNFKYSLGAEWGGIYNNDGKNKRSLGLSLGFSYILKDEENLDSYSFHFSFSRKGIFSKSGDRIPESMFQIAASCYFY